MTVFNFSAGFCGAAEEVLQRAAAEMLDWHGSGMSVMEMSHRGPEFIAIAERPKPICARCSRSAPTTGAVPAGRRDRRERDRADEPARRQRPSISSTRVSGRRSRSGGEEVRAGQRRAPAAERNYSYVPARTDWKLSPQAAYVHVCTNETIGGVEYHWVPDVGSVPLVADMSSHILSRPIDISKYGVIYGGAQKNVGPAGLTLVIVRKDLLDRALPITPSAFHWKEQAAADSMLLNTPPTYAIYIAGMVFEWLLAQGGLAAIEQKNIAKAKLLYDAIDASSLYSNPVAREDRSRMNVPFKLRDGALDAPFLKGAQQRGLLQLKGHRSVGGMRASIYNAMPIEGVQALVDYLREFERSQG
jgi:phosphoserine aminotransferase